MKYFLTIAAAGVFALSTVGATVGVANACGAHDHKSAQISKPVTTAESPVMTPQPEG